MTSHPRRIAIFTLGSRGDVQPFLALALALQTEGHQVTFVAPLNFERRIKSYDLEFVPIPIDINAMGEKSSVKDLLDHGWRFWRVIATFKNLWDDIQAGLHSTGRILAEASRAHDLIISHPLLAPFSMTIRETQKIPVLFASPVPINPTAVFPSAMSPVLPIDHPRYNPFSYYLAFRLIFSLVLAPANAYRQSIGLKKYQMGDFISAFFKEEILYAFSPHFVPPVPEWGANVQPVGTWTLPPKADWTPPDDLEAFLAAGDAPVYIGFGSMKVGNPGKVSAIIAEGLKLAGRRGILQVGWANLHYHDEHVLTIADCPHEWLFPQMAAIVHHGGAGTTHAALRAGKPMLVVPLFGDQFFWAKQSVKIGVGVPFIPIQKFNAQRFADALRQLDSPQLMQRAAELGALARAEDGVQASLPIIEQIIR